MIRGGVRLLLRAFFREIDIVGLENLPRHGGGLFVSWHPNALIDPSLILASSSRRVVFGARDGLVRMPLLGAVLRGAGTVPIYRAVDDGSGDVAARREANRKSLDALAERVAAGTFAALFPEGVSHDEPHPVEFKSGAARLYYRARSLQESGATPPVIIPVGLHYDRKRVFRSGAVVWFHPPIVLAGELDGTPDPDEPDETGRERARKLTAVFAEVLGDVVLATEDWEVHRGLHRVRKLVRAERSRRKSVDPGRTSPEERAVGFARVRAGYFAVRKNHPQRAAALRDRVERYDENLKALGLDDHHLDRAPGIGTRGLVFWLFLQAAFVYLFLPPFLLVGLVVNAPAALLVKAIASTGATLQKDVASLKIMAGAVIFPLAWIAVGVAGARIHEKLRLFFPALPDRPILAGVTLALAAIVGAAASVRYLHLARRTARALRIRLTRARRRSCMERLRVERSDLYDALIELAGGLDLPGSIGDDGRFRAD